MLRTVRSQWENRDAPVNLRDAAAIPYATLGARVNGSREQILILATDSGAERLWTSGAKAAITTRNGRIVRTAGFGQDLTGYIVSAGSISDWATPHRYTWNADFADKGIYSASVECKVHPLGSDPITILGKQIDTTQIDEDCHSSQLNWNFTNSYWVSIDSGRVWRSIQHVHPDGLVLEIELLRPPFTPG
jgi:hypothetical protein